MSDEAARAAGPLLDVRGLTTDLVPAHGPHVRLVDGVSFSIPRGGTLGLVGESGCGKSVTALSLLGLLRAPARVVSGTAHFEGQDLLALDQDALRRVRGDRVAMVFQEPMTALNPVFTVGAQIAEVVRLHRGASRAEARARAVEVLRQVGIPAPEERVDAYPHQLSGGMRQRAVIAMALACDPALLVADEPTTALDVTLQAQVLELLARLRSERGLAVLLITHDLGVVAEACDAVAVMYAGRVVERADTRALFARPAHPYTAGLLRSIPSFEDARARRRLQAIPGMVPSPRDRPAGCPYRPRCERASDVCARVDPPLEEKRPGQWAACHHPVPPPEVAA